MDNEENSPQPDDPPVTTGEDEVERLLAQAQALADDIATTTGVESAERDQDSAPSSQDVPTGDQSDALAAAETVEGKVTDLEGLVVGEASEPAPAEGADGQPPAKSKDPPAKPGAEAIDPPAEIAPPDKVDAADAAPPRDDPANRDTDTLLAGDVDLDLGRPEEAEDDAGKGDETDSAESRPKGSFKERIAAARSSVTRTGHWVTNAVCRATATAFLVLDRPFANVPRRAKKLLGIIGLITLLTGVAAWVLPGMLEHNPYEHLPLDR
jgi:hypothetical protein